MSEMKERYGESLCFTDQERYQCAGTAISGSSSGEKRSVKVFGLERNISVLCIYWPVQQPDLHRGSCGALSKPLRENNGKYKHVFVFEDRDSGIINEKAGTVLRTVPCFLSILQSFYLLCPTGLRLYQTFILYVFPAMPIKLIQQNEIRQRITRR